jgi:hypothetical protein
MVLGYSLRRTAFLRSIEAAGGERKTNAFVENHRMKEVQKEETIEIENEHKIAPEAE